jgi:hypothetical protein
MSRLARFAPAALIVSLAAVAACDAPTPTAPAPAPALPGPSFSNAAFSVTSNETFPMTDVVVNPCNGESVQLGGTVHDVVHVTINGNVFSVMEHANGADVSGVGRTTGASYKGNDVLASHFSAAAGVETSVVESITMNAKGSTPSFVIKLVEHITIDANGVVTASVDNRTTSCH